MTPELQKLIFQLIDAGEDLTDAAETCGHDEALADWERIVKKAKKTIGYDGIARTANAELQSARHEKQKKKDEAADKKRRAEEAATMAEFGCFTPDGKLIL